MGLTRGRSTQTLISKGRVLFLIVSLGFVMPTIMAAPIMTPLTYHIQVSTMVEKGTTSDGFEIGTHALDFYLGNLLHWFYCFQLVNYYGNTLLDQS